MSQEKQDAEARSITATVLGTLTLCAGLAAFLVPLHHPGPYGIPGRGLVGGLLCFAISAALLFGAAPTIVRRIGMLASPFVLFLALYGAFAELEEVIVLYAPDAELRLWIVDHDGVEWVSMPRSKAEAHSLDGAQLELLRAGVTRCVVPRLVDDPLANRRTFDLRQEKYAVQRLGGLLGMFGDGPSAQTITLRLDPCGRAIHRPGASSLVPRRSHCGDLSPALRCRDVDLHIPARG